MRSLGLLLAASALLAGGAFLWERRAPAPVPTRVLLLEPISGAGLDAPTARSLGSLLLDQMELRSPLAVTSLPRLPQPFQPEGELLVVRPWAAREGDRLRLSLDWALMGPGQAGAWHAASPPLSDPAAAIEDAVSGLPIHLAPPDPALLPSGPAAFWGLLAADQAIHSNTGLDVATASAQRLAGEQPDCAALQATVAHLDTIRILQDPHPLDGRVDLALAAAERALKLEPGYPRALRFEARLLSDEGRQAQALDELQDGLRRHPHSMNLLFALDYTARTAGLMDIALATRAKIRALWAGAPEPPPIGFAYLYAGQMEAFEASFLAQPGEALDGFSEFNLGYAKLLRGQTAEAELHFGNAERDAATEAHFRALAKAFRLQIEGKAEDARAALDALDRSRVGLQVPDGEFTFTMAEAAAYLGEEGRAMDLAERAFSQGFTCSAWYRSSPFLAKLQALPRWRAILQHVDERRARLAAGRQPSDFGL